MQEKELSPVQQFYIWLEQELDDLAQNGPKVKRGRKPSKKQYFTYINEKAIVAFNKETNQSLRNKVFKEHIYKPFDKLVENLIHTFKFYYFDVPYTDVKAEVVAFLVEKIKNIKEVLDSGDRPTTQQEKPGKISTDLFDELFGDKK